MTEAGTTRYVQAARSVTRASFYVLGASIPISIALDNVLMVVILTSWIIAGRYDDTWRIVRRNAVALFACGWFLAHVLGAVYSVGDASDIARAIRKAATFLLIPIAVTLMHDARDRDRAFYGFMAAVALTSVLAYLRWFGLLPDAPWWQPEKFGTTVVFKKSLTQNLLLAMGAFLFTVYAIRCKRPSLRALFWGCAAFIALDVVYLGEGRTGQIALLALIVYLGWCLRGRSGLLLAVVIAGSLAGAVYVLPGSTLHKRSTVAVKEAAEWQEGDRSRTSTGQRLEFYSTTLGVISERPLLGAGTGGFAEAYRRHVSGTVVPPTNNPHSEYLLKAAEFGVWGLALIIAMFVTFWRSAALLRDRHDLVIARGVLLWLALASVFSSTLSDHTEGLFFAWATGILFGRLPTRDS